MPVPELSHNKICNLEDFADPELRTVLRDVFAHEVVRFGESFPSGKENRKDWEAAMALRAFDACGLLDGGADFLGVAAGNEPLLFHLTRLARSVHATDLYLAAGAWEVFGHQSMLDDPYEHWPFTWNPRRLVVQHMDALDLRYEDETFDGVFSSSSIEHIGGHAEVRRCMDELFRVLRPGGVCAVSTEFRLAGPSPGIEGTLLFDEQELLAELIGDRAWEPVSPLDLTVSEATRATTVDVLGVVAQQLAQCHRDGGWFTHKLDYEQFPHIVMGIGEHVFTSVSLALRKDGARPAPASRRREALGGKPPAVIWEAAPGGEPLTGSRTVDLAGAEVVGARWRHPALDVPILVGAGTTIEVLVIAGAIQGLRVEVNGLPVACEPEPTDEGTCLRGVVPASYASARRFTRLTLGAPGPGVTLGWARFTAPSAPAAP
ncbi:MAG: class I SAM-dependent methyltransferase [Acidimicrobiales bacterium]